MSANSSSAVALDDDPIFYEGEPPPDAPSAVSEIEYLIWTFEAVSRPGAHVSFCLSHAVGSFSNRKTADNALTIEDACRLKSAAGAALRTALKHPDTRSMRHLRTGFAAIVEAIDVWLEPRSFDPGKFVRNVCISIVKHEAAVADKVSLVSAYQPAAWEKLHRSDLTGRRK